MGTIIVIVILIFLIPNIINSISKANATAKEQAAKQKELLEIQNQYEELKEKYAESKVTIEILNYICDGNYKKNLPEEIVIDYNKIHSILRGRTYVFDFQQRRLKPLHHENWNINPNQAMAEVFNQLLQEEYSISSRSLDSSAVYMTLEAKIDF